MKFAAEFTTDPCALSSEARIEEAVQACWSVENMAVILLNADGVREREWRTQFQALGLDVFAGANSLNVGDMPAIVIDAQAWNREDIRRQVEYLRLDKPDAVVCIVTGLLASGWKAQSRPSIFDDARAFLQEAGFRFFSFGGASNDYPALS